MKKKKFDPFKHMKLDREEQELSDAIERGEFKEVEHMEEEKKRLVSYAKYTLALEKKDKRINIRVKHSDLDTIRHRAEQNGLPYQTLMSTILHQFAQGKIKITL